MNHHVLLTLVLALAVSGTCHAKPPANHTCLHQWMVQSGIPLESAVDYEETIRSVHYGVGELRERSALAIGILMMNGNVAHAKLLKTCIAGHKTDCQNYQPCYVGGSCVLSEDRSTYKCRCAPGRKGQFCQHDIDYCASNPCQHGGFCKDGVTNFTCTCAAGFEGMKCEKQWLQAESLRKLPAIVEALETKTVKLEEKNSVLERKVLEMQKTIDHPERTQEVVGYAYDSIYNLNDDRDSGQLRTFTFQKKLNSTLLRLTNSMNIATLSSGTQHWYFEIDGSPCSTPSNIDISMSQNTNDNTYVPSVLTGICSATGAGPILAGSHEISVHTKGNVNAYSGHVSLSFLQVQEIVPPF